MRCPFCNEEVEIPSPVYEVVPADEENAFKEAGLLPGNAYISGFETRICQNCGAIYTFTPSWDTDESILELMEEVAGRSITENEPVANWLGKSEVKEIPFYYIKEKPVEKPTVQTWMENEGEGFIVFLKPPPFTFTCTCGRTIGDFLSFGKEFRFKCSHCGKNYSIKSKESFYVWEKLPQNGKTPGGKIKCPFCGTKTQLPRPITITVPDEKAKKYVTPVDTNATPGIQ